MIVVIGQPAYRPAREGRADAADGRAVRIAAAAAAAGSRVELLGRVGDDRAGDALLVGLARDGIGHAAILRDPTRPTPIVDTATHDEGEPLVPVPELGAWGNGSEPASVPVVPPSEEEQAAAAIPALDPGDLELGLRYLVDYHVVVAAEPLGEQLARVVADAVTFAEAALVAIVPPSGETPPAFAAATVIAAPEGDPDGAFAALVGRFAAALDAGEDAAAAFGRARAALGWEPAEA